MEIEFAPHINLTQDRQKEVADWPVMQEQIESREKKGLITSRVLVNGVSYKPNKPDILIVHARVYYIEPGGRKNDYGVNFIDDAVMPLVVFRAVSDETTKRTKPNLDDLFVLAIREFRYAAAQNVFSPPLGLAERGAGPLIERALKELSEETGITSLHDISGIQFRPSGTPFMRQASTTDFVYPFVAEVDIAKVDLEDLAAKLAHTEAGDATEGERTRPNIVPMREAWLTAVREGHEAAVTVVLDRFLLDKHLLTLG